jgi:hypothetical protein
MRSVGTTETFHYTLPSLPPVRWRLWFSLLYDFNLIFDIKKLLNSTVEALLVLVLLPDECPLSVWLIIAFNSVYVKQNTAIKSTHFTVVGSGSGIGRKFILTLGRFAIALYSSLCKPADNAFSRSHHPSPSMSPVCLRELSLPGEWQDSFLCFKADENLHQNS